MAHFSVEVRVLDLHLDPLQAFSSEFGSSNPHFLLESSLIVPGFSRFSFMGDSHGRHGESITYDKDTAIAEVSGYQSRADLHVPDFFDWLGERLQAHACPCTDLLPFDFNLGYVGALGYELKSETIGAQAWSSGSHDAAFMLATRMIVIDHVEQRSYLLCLVQTDADRDLASTWFDQAQARLQALPVAAPRSKLARRMDLPAVEAWVEQYADMRHDKPKYLAMIADAQRQITDGESYEVCLTNLIEFPFCDSAFELYRVMRDLTPAPNGAYFAMDDFRIVSSSPERFLKVDRDRHVEAKPIKGTRPRGRDAEEDAGLIEHLLNDEKDRAENLMIVDLLRNDLGQVCTIGSVQVPSLFAVETYSHVHQLVSTIGGQLKAGVGTVECVRATFPGGSMTGAPKKRTMEIIDRLEEGPRGAYSGSLGWFGLGGACDLNILIRSVTVDGEMARFGVGGAITSLSDPEGEYTETVVKASGVVEAVARLWEARV